MTRSSTLKQRKIGLVLLISFSWVTPICAYENENTVTVAVFGLFRPSDLDLTIQRNAIVSIRNGSAEMKRVLAVGQRLRLVARHGEGLQVCLFEQNGRLLLEHHADAVRTEETLCTLSVPGRIQRAFYGRLEIVARGSLLLPRITVQEESAVEQILRSEMAVGQQPEALKAQAI